jgi:hypothetical protein
MKPADYSYLEASSQFGNVVLSPALNNTMLPRIFAKLSLPVPMASNWGS